MGFSKRTLVAVVVCLTPIFTIAQQQPRSRRVAPTDDFSSWKQVSPEGGGFSISFPSAPRYEEKERASGVIMRSLKFEGKGVAYQITYSALPVSQARQVQSRIEGHDMAQAKRELGRNLIEQNKLTIGEYPALEMIMEIPIGGYTRTINVATNDHFYVLSIGAANVKGLRTAEVEHFIASFKLKE